MRVALHFDADYPGLSENGSYSVPIYRTVFDAFLRSPSANRCSMICVGDFPRRYLDRAAEIFAPIVGVWTTIKPEDFRVMERHNIFVIYFDNVAFDAASALDSRLRALPWYLGILQIETALPMHRVVYEDSLIPNFRIIHDYFYMLWDGDEEEKDDWMFEEFRTMGFEHVAYELFRHVPSWLTSISEDEVVSLFEPLADSNA